MAGPDGGAVRTTITVPAQLKREMEAVAERVNWSAVAAEAFRTKLREIESTTGGKSMEETVKRLRAAAALEADQDYAAGLEAGKRWAMEDAKPRELRRLARLLELGVGTPREIVENADSRNEGIPRSLAASITGEEMSYNEAASFWEGVLGDGGDEIIDSAGFATGFYEAAVGVWREVEDQL